MNLLVYTIFTDVLHTVFLKLASKNIECPSFKSVFMCEQVAWLSDVYNWFIVMLLDIYDTHSLKLYAAYGTR